MVELAGMWRRWSRCWSSDLGDHHCAVSSGSCVSSSGCSPVTSKKRPTKPGIAGGGFAFASASATNREATKDSKFGAPKTTTRSATSWAAAGESGANGTRVARGRLEAGGLVGLETIFAIKAISEQVAPPTINLENPDEGFDLDFVAREAREAPIRVAVNNSFGFGGHNVSLILKAYSGE